MSLSADEQRDAMKRLSEKLKAAGMVPASLGKVTGVYPPIPEDPAQPATLSTSQDSFLNSPVFESMARRIEVLSEQLTNVDEARRDALEDANRRFSDMVLAKDVAVDLAKRIKSQSKEISALRAKLPREPPAPPTAGETIARCMRTIFPQER